MLASCYQRVRQLELMARNHPRSKMPQKLGIEIGNNLVGKHNFYLQYGRKWPREVHQVTKGFHLFNV